MLLRTGDCVSKHCSQEEVVEDRFMAYLARWEGMKSVVWLGGFGLGVADVLPTVREHIHQLSCQLSSRARFGM